MKTSMYILALLAIVNVSTAQERAMKMTTSDERVSIVTGGASEWTVFVPADAGIVERFAADELKKYVKLISGADLGETTKAKGRRVILVGLRSAVSEYADLPEPKKGFDGYCIVIEPHRIVIAGENPRGVMYGVYDVLERLGCRWYQPNIDAKDPEVVPRSPDLSLEEGEWSEAAAIELRLYNGSAFFFAVVPDRVLPQIEWAARNRYSGLAWQPHHGPGKLEEELEQYKACGAFDEMEKRGLIFHGPCHSFPHFLPTEKYFKDHPEWFGMLNGERKPHGGQWPLVNYCWSNPEANEEFMKNVEAFVKRWPQIRILNLEWIDGGVVCQCPACAERGGPNLIVELFNTLSERLEKVAPEVTLEAVLGYGPIDQPPTGTMPNRKWQGVYAHWGRNNRTSYVDLDYVRRPNLMIWLSQFPQWEMCSYYGAGSHTPFNGPPFIYALENDIRFLVDYKARGSYILHYPHGMWWNYSFTLGEAGRQAYYYPNRPVRDAVSDYAMTYFGPKAGPLLAEYLLIIGSNENLEKSYRASVGEADSHEMSWFADMKRLVDRAAWLASDDPVVSYRIAKLSAGLEVLMKLGPGREKVRAIEKALAEWRAGTKTSEEVAKLIEEGRAYVKEVRELADKNEAAYPGVIGGEWLESWTMNRILTEPFKKFEKELTSDTSAEKPKKPDHVAGPD